MIRNPTGGALTIEAACLLIESGVFSPACQDATSLTWTLNL